MKPIIIMLTSAGLLAVSQMLTAPVLADQNPTQPRLDYGGTKDRPPRTATVSALPDQIRLSLALGDPVMSQSGGELGTIGDIWIDRDGRAAVVTLADKKGAIPWSSLVFQGKPTPRFVVNLTADDLRNAPQPSEAVGLRDVKSDLFGRTAVDEQGHELGTVSDLVATFSSGTIDAVVIETGSALLPKEEHALAWSAVRPEPKGKALVLSVSSDQLAHAPVLTTKAPKPAQDQAGGAASNPSSGSSQAPSELGVGTVGRVPEPSTRRD